MNALLLLSLFLGSEAPQQNQAAVSQTDVDRAIARGIEWLKKAPEPTAPAPYNNADELVFLTVLHGGLSEKDDFFQKLLNRILAAPLEKTYKVALQAMALEELDRVKHQIRIAECGQFLVDNQCKNGQWSYGAPTKFDLDLKTYPPIETSTKPKSDKATPKLYEEREKPKVLRKIPVKKTRDGPDSGDNSNSQYASLGLRACHDAGIVIPDETISRARQWWTDSQHPPEDGVVDPKAVASGTARPQGWNYKTPADGKPTHAMTAGALGAVVIYDYMIGRDWKKDSVAQAGAMWLGKHFAVNGNYYYMYGLERAGMLYDTPTFGGRDWYFEGARFLLGAQNDDGSWCRKADAEKHVFVWDTCFAILFLKKATRPVATQSAK